MTNIRNHFPHLTKKDQDITLNLIKQGVKNHLDIFLGPPNDGQYYGQWIEYGTDYSTFVYKPDFSQKKVSLTIGIFMHVSKPSFFGKPKSYMRSVMAADIICIPSMVGVVEHEILDVSVKEMTSGDWMSQISNQIETKAEELRNLRPIEQQLISDMTSLDHDLFELPPFSRYALVKDRSLSNDWNGD